MSNSNLWDFNVTHTNLNPPEIFAAVVLTFLSSTTDRDLRPKRRDNDKERLIRGVSIPSEANPGRQTYVPLFHLNIFITKQFVPQFKGKVLPIDRMHITNVKW